MPLELHGTLKSRLVETIARGLRQIEVKNGMFVDHTSKFMALHEAEAALPDHGHLRDRLLTYIDEVPLIEFAGDVLSAELRRLGSGLITNS